MLLQNLHRINLIFLAGMKRVRRVLNRLRNRIQNRGEADQPADLAAAEPSSSSSSEAELQPSAPLDGESISSVSEAELQPSAPPASDSSTSFEILDPAPPPFSIYEDPESPRAGPSSGSLAAFARCRPRLRPVLIDVRFPLFLFSDFPYRLRGAEYSRCCIDQIRSLRQNPGVAWFPCPICHSPPVRVNGSSKLQCSLNN